MTGEGPKIPTRYTHRQLATMIGSKRETVTKAFTLLQQGGAVQLKRRRIHVKDIEVLRNIADQGPHSRLGEPVVNIGASALPRRTGEERG
jgi:DNA-binding transcriptional regulator YhcF (GntR family)